MREYKIFEGNLGWSIYRKKQMGKILMVQYLNGYDMRTPHKISAKIFYTKESAISALVIMKTKDEKKSD